MTKRFIERDGDRRAFADAAQAVDVVGRQRLFERGDVETVERARDAQRDVDRVALVGIDPQERVVTGGGAHTLDGANVVVLAVIECACEAIESKRFGSRRLNGSVQGTHECEVQPAAEHLAVLAGDYMPRLLLRFVLMSSCVGLLAACSGGSAATPSASSNVVPASSGTAAGFTAPAATTAPGFTPVAGSQGSVRHTKDVSTVCSSSPDASDFNGMPGNSNNSGGSDTVTVGGFGNVVCDNSATVVGGQSNIVNSGGQFGAALAFIGGGSGNHITGGVGSIIAGGSYNTVSVTESSSIGGSAIGGGYQNTVHGVAAVVAGGYQLTASGDQSFAGGGYGNTAGGQFSAVTSGEYNMASAEGAFVGGGGYNTASGEGAIVDGGFNSTANGAFATIAGGYVNSAAGTYSFAAGARASAAQNGTFVWSDGSDGDTILTSSRAYQFLARASGGVTFWTNAASTVGATLAPGSGTWASASDRNLKTDVARIDDAAVLDKVAALPIARWSYKSERGVRHVGPMAQDFYAAFGVGEDDKHITSIDEDGVALAAIKALHAENASLRARQATMERQLERLTAAVSVLRARR